MKLRMFAAVAAAVALLAAACGGGGGTSTPTAAPTKAATTAPATAQPTKAATTAATTSAAGGAATSGEQLFNKYCATCHGSNAAGGYKLGEAEAADLRWAKLGDMYSNNTSLVAQSITQGKDEQGKDLSEVMPRWQNDLTTEQVNNIIAYLQTLTTDAPPNEPPAAPAGATPGQQLYFQYCALCHGDDGAGNTDVGTSTSADLRWTRLGDMYNGDVNLVARAVLQGLDEQGKPLDPEMPHWAETLTADQVQQIITFLQTLK